MNKFLGVLIVLSFVACSSAEKKQTEAEMAQPVAQTTEAATEATKDASSTKQDDGSLSTCTMDSDTRVIEVKKTEGGGCELFYTKFGEAKSVASAGFGTQYCEEVKERIQSNLVKAGFACK